MKPGENVAGENVAGKGGALQYLTMGNKECCGGILENGCINTGLGDGKAKTDGPQNK